MSSMVSPRALLQLEYEASFKPQWHRLSSMASQRALLQPEYETSFKLQCSSFNVWSSHDGQHPLAQRNLPRGHCLSFELSPWPIEMDTGALTVVNTDWLNTACCSLNTKHRSSFNGLAEGSISA